MTRRPISLALPISLAVLAAIFTAGLLAAVALPRPGGGGSRAHRSDAPYPHVVLVGIGDQKPAMFSDPRFAALGLRHARLTVAWDAMDSRRQRARLDVWMRHARAAHVAPLVTFDHSWRRGHHRQLPSPGRFGHEFRMLRSRYPWVRDYSTWNEANLCGEPTCHRVALVAAYYRTLRHNCPGCHVLAAELLDLPNMVSWARQFRRAARVDPHFWGLHNYIGANRFSDASTRALLRVTHGQLWFTETGGLVVRRNRSKVHFRQSAAHAANVTRYLFHSLATLSPRITRVYLYEWNALTSRDSWDSALIGADRRPRPAYAVLVHELDAFRHIPAPPPSAPSDTTASDTTPSDTAPTDTTPTAPSPAASASTPAPGP
ncbi:MAG TPA: hypothetical protein VGN69_07730 [Solirubrobacteraceae bacterium]|jgi:hypothetical protein|nr:hypothetical protein [Solirubrobacteraceae bacterium]